MKSLVQLEPGDWWETLYVVVPVTQRSVHGTNHPLARVSPRVSGGVMPVEPEVKGTVLVVAIGEPKETVYSVRHLDQGNGLVYEGMTDVVTREAIVVCHEGLKSTVLAERIIKK